MTRLRSLLLTLFALVAFFLFTFFFATPVASAQATVITLDDRFALERVAGDLAFPTSVAFAPPPATAASTSAFTTRPFGPLPVTAERSMPASFAMRRAKGEEKVRSPVLADAEAAGAGAAAGFSAGLPSSGFASG